MPLQHLPMPIVNPAATDASVPAGVTPPFVPCCGCREKQHEHKETRECDDEVETISDRGIFEDAHAGKAMRH